VLGLVALAWGLLVAPLLHRETHAHGHSHSHGPAQPSAPHGGGSLEHQALSFVESPAAPAPVFIATVVTLPAAPGPAWVVPSALRRVEQSQAP
jgi:hypothetical protein